MPENDVSFGNTASICVIFSPGIAYAQFRSPPQQTDLRKLCGVDSTFA